MQVSKLLQKPTQGIYEDSRILAIYYALRTAACDAAIAVASASASEACLQFVTWKNVKGEDIMVSLNGSEVGGAHVSNRYNQATTINLFSALGYVVPAASPAAAPDAAPDAAHDEVYLL